jgi:hypothetical protein
MRYRLIRFEDDRPRLEFNVLQVGAQCLEIAVHERREQSILLILRNLNSPCGLAPERVKNARRPRLDPAERTVF